MSEWVEMELGQFIELKRGYDLPKKNREEGTVPLVSSSGETDLHNVAKVKGPGVVTGRYGTIGQVFYVEEDFWPLNTTLYVKDFKGNDPLFVYYFLKTISYRDYSDKAAVPGINRNHLHKAEIRVPVDSVYQRELAEKLWALDSKIELNRQTNQTLEQIAQAIFKSWFVDFEPVKAKIKAKQNGQDPELAAMCAISGLSTSDAAGAEEQLKGLDQVTQQQLKTTTALFPDAMVESELGEIPEGWRVKSLDEIAEFLNGLALQKFPAKENEEGLPVIKIAEMRSGFSGKSGKATKDLESNYIIQNGDILFSWSGSLLVKQWCSGAGALNQHLFKVTSDIYPKWFYFYATQHHLPWFQSIAASKATTMGHIQRKHLSDAMAAICTSELFDMGDKIIGPLIDKSLEVMLESKTLEEMRDSLLPKLLSGELEVKVA